MVTSAPSPSGHGLNHAERVLAAVVNGDVGAELLSRFQAAVRQVDGDDVAGAEQARAHDGGQPDRAGPDYGHDIAGLDTAVEDADLVAGGQDVGHHQELLVGHAVGHGVGRQVGERHADVLGLGSVDLVAEDPAAAAQALPVPALAAEPACPARGDAGDEHPVAGPDPLHAAADRLDRPDGLVTQDASVGDGGHVSLENVQIGPADRDGLDADDRVSVVGDLGFRHVFPGLLAWTVVDKSAHGSSRSYGVLVTRVLAATLGLQSHRSCRDKAQRPTSECLVGLREVVPQRRGHHGAPSLSASRSART
jgi:hypothetical protein